MNTIVLDEVQVTKLGADGAASIVSLAVHRPAIASWQHNQYLTPIRAWATFLRNDTTPPPPTCRGGYALQHMRRQQAVSPHRRQISVRRPDGPVWS